VNDRRPAAWLPARWDPDAAMRLFCLPYAGGGASVYSGWLGALSNVDVVPIHLPGREERLREPAYDRMEPLVDDLAGALASHLDRPYAVFGHSMGGLVAYELVRTLRRLGRPDPVALLVSACWPPHHRVPRPPDPGWIELLRRVKRLGGTPSEVFHSPELVRLVLPAMRADFALVDTYAYRPGAPLDVPTTVLYGREDPQMSAEQAAAWAELTARPPRTIALPGGHFNLTEQPEAVIAAVDRALSADRSAPAQANGRKP
jgi:medium-chain acyl-[acyl-carrier-protein] hydrolase